MFGNLVRIEVIRLYKNIILKISAALAAFLMLISLMSSEIILQNGGLRFIRAEEITPVYFHVYFFEVMFESLVMIVAGLTVAFTTCDYYKYRLSVNIEGAIRSRVKLFLSELCGIAIFTAAINLLVFPGLAVILAGHPAEIISVFTSDYDEILSVYFFSFCSCLFVSIIVYLLSKITHKAPVAVLLSILVGIAAVVLLVFTAGFISGSRGEGVIAGRTIEDVLLGSVILIPVIVLSVIALVNNSKEDRV